MRARRVDANHRDIIAALRKCGASVKDTSRLPGFVDCVIGFRKRLWLAEIKDGDKPPSARKLTPDEQDFHDTWRGPAIVILTGVGDAMTLIAGAETK